MEAQAAKAACMLWRAQRMKCCPSLASPCREQVEAQAAEAARMLGRRLKEVERTARGLAARERHAASREASLDERRASLAQREGALAAADAELGDAQARLAWQVPIPLAQLHLRMRAVDSTMAPAAHACCQRYADMGCFVTHQASQPGVVPRQMQAAADWAEANMRCSLRGCRAALAA